MANEAPYASAHVTFIPRQNTSKILTPADKKLFGRLINAMSRQPGNFDYVDTFQNRDSAHSTTSLFLFNTPEQVKNAFDAVRAEVNKWIPRGRKPPDIRVEDGHMYVTARKGMAPAA